MRGIVEQVSLSHGGVPKWAVDQAWIGPLGLEGDMHRNLKHHGGPGKAVLMVSAEVLAGLRAEGFDVNAGSLGENLTISGIDFAQLRARMRLRAGGAVLDLTQLRQPCATLDIYNRPGFRIQTLLYDALCKAGDASSARWAKGGFYAATVQPGCVRPGDILELLDEVA